MPSKTNRSSEHDIAHAVMKYLRTIPSKSADTSAIKKHVPNFIKLADADKEPSETRNNEQVWQQVVGNIVSHRNDSPENYINRGLLEYDGQQIKLTPSGEKHLDKLNA